MGPQSIEEDIFPPRENLTKTSVPKWLFYPRKKLTSVPVDVSLLALIAASRGHFH